MKKTLWTEIKLSDCTILKDYGEPKRITHPDFPRPRYFIKSLKGNWYWRNTGRDEGFDPFARGIIIK